MADMVLRPQARVAVRTANFLSNYLQNAYQVVTFLDKNNVEMKSTDLSQDQMFGEVLANVVADDKLFGSAILWKSRSFKGSSGRSVKFVTSFYINLFRPYPLSLPPNSLSLPL